MKNNPFCCRSCFILPDLHNSGGMKRTGICFFPVGCFCVAAAHSGDAQVVIILLAGRVLADYQFLPAHLFYR